MGFAVSGPAVWIGPWVPGHGSTGTAQAQHAGTGPLEALQRPSRRWTTPFRVYGDGDRGKERSPVPTASSGNTIFTVCYLSLPAAKQRTYDTSSRGSKVRSHPALISSHHVAWHGIACHRTASHRMSAAREARARSTAKATAAAAGHIRQRASHPAVLKSPAARRPRPRPRPALKHLHRVHQTTPHSVAGPSPSPVLPGPRPAAVALL